MMNYLRFLRLPGIPPVRSHYARQYNAVVWMSFLGPVAVAWVFGIATGKEWSFYLAMFMASLFAPIIGVPDMIFAVADWLDRRRKIERANRRTRHIVGEFGEAFREQVAGLGFDELFIMGAAIGKRRPAFNRATGDAATATLMKRGFVTRVTGYRPDGFPFVFVDLTWTLMQELAHEVLLERDKKGPEGNRLADGHVPQELFALFPERYAEPVPASQALAQIGAALAVHIGYLVAIVTVIPVVWATMVFALAVGVGVLLGGGWALIWLFGLL